MGHLQNSKTGHASLFYIFLNFKERIFMTWGAVAIGFCFLVTMHFKQRKRKLSNTLERSLFKMHNKGKFKILIATDPLKGGKSYGRRINAANI